MRSGETDKEDLLKCQTSMDSSPCYACTDRLCYWYHSRPQRCELEIARRYLGEMYRLSRPSIMDQDYPNDAHLPSTILRDQPWDMSIRNPKNPSNWLDPFVDETVPEKTGKREFPEEHTVRCEFCGKDILYKTRKPIYNVCDTCKLRLVKSHERGDIVDLLNRNESVLETDDVVTPSLPDSRLGPRGEKGRLSRLELSQMAPVDRRGTAGTRGTQAMDDTVVLVRGKRRVKGAVWLQEQAEKSRKRV